MSRMPKLTRRVCLWGASAGLASALLALGRSNAAPTKARGAPPPHPRKPDELSMTVERVVIFKDGHALILKRAEALADELGTVFTHEVPDAAILGTFWAIADKGLTVRSMRAEWTDEEVQVERSIPCRAPGDVVASNPGKQVTVDVQGGSFTGTILAPPPTQTEAGSAARPPSSRSSQLFESSALVASPSSLVPMDGDNGVVALALPEKGTVVVASKDILRATGPELALRCQQTRLEAQRRKRLTLELGPDAAKKKVSVRLMYFSPGLRWIPTWRLEREEKRGTLSLQAELLNELEELRGASVDLAVGVPNFRFKETLSPLSLEAVVRNTLAQAAPSLMGSMNTLSNASFTQHASEWSPAGDSGSAHLAPELEGESDGHDIWVHPVSALTLPRGARAVVPLTQERVEVTDVYTLEVKVRRDGQDSVSYGRSQSSSPLRLAKAEIWHQVELENAGKTPWTTGPVLVTERQVPQAQELLTYTPRGGTTRVPLTVAVDMRALHDEVETDRKERAIQYQGHHYPLIRKRGTLSLSNPRPQDVQLQISLSTAGTVERASDGGKVRRDDHHFEDGGLPVNGHSDVVWTLTLHAGERRTVSYEVSFYR